MKETATDKNQPCKKFKAGAITATVWRNTEKNHEGKEFVYYSVTVVRNYTVDGKQWNTSDSYRINDLPKVVLVSQLAYEYIALMEKDKDERQDEL